MTIRRPLALALLAVLACSNSTGLDDVKSIRVLPANPSIDVGLTVQFTAEALDENGTVVPNVQFTWASSDPTVATVDADGLAVAHKIGTTAITASAGSAQPGSRVLVVEPTQCTSRIDVVLDPGQHQAYDGDTCLFLPTGSVGDRYRVAVIRPTLIEDPADVPNVWLEINPVLTAEQTAGAAAVEPAPVQPATYSTSPGLVDAALRIDGTRFVEDRRIMERTRRFHTELRQREMDLGLQTRSVLPSRPMLTTGPTRVDPPAKDDFFLGLDCDDTTSSRVVLVDFNDDVAIYQDSVANEASPLSQSATGQMLDYYSSYVKGFIEQYWGATPDIDANERVLVTTSDALPDSAAAAVFSGDFNSTAACASSNEAEIMYFSADVIEALADPDPSYLALSVMAHEVKHVTSLYHGVARGSFHNIWIEEGTAEVSQTMSSRIAWAAVGGPPVGSVLDGSDIIEWNNQNGEIGPEAWGVVGQIADVIVHLATQPNSLITNPNGAEDFHSFYAGGWHWHRFIGDAFGNASDPLADGPLFVEMTDSLTPSGTGALLAVTGRTFEQLFEDLIVGMSFHDAGPVPTFAFTTWDLATATGIFSGPPIVAPPHWYPWPVTAGLASGDQPANPSRSFEAGVYSCPPRYDEQDDRYELASPSDRCPMGPSGIRFHDFVSGGEGAGAQVQVFGAANGRLIVTRLN